MHTGSPSDTRRTPRDAPRLRPLAAALSAIALGLGLATGDADARETAGEDGGTEKRQSATFDVETLRARGIDPKLAEYFREAPRFREGTHVVTLVVNGMKAGLVDATFDANGGLCFTAALLEKAGLQVPRGDEGATGDATQCYDFIEAWPQTQVTLRPGREEVSLLVPTDAFRAPEVNLSGFATGGTAGLVNYDIMAMSSHTGGNANTYLYTATDVGVNVGDWVLRSRQLYTSNDGRGQFNHLYAYAQRTFAQYGSTLQAGQINIASPLFAGAPLTGMQVLPETALATRGNDGPRVEGIAQSEARVEIRQAGALIYSTQVPAGPFSLSGIPLLNSRTDLDVTVVEANGAEHRFVVPAASFGSAMLAPPGYSFAAGRIRDLGDVKNPAPWVITGAGSWALGRQMVTSAGLMGSTDYQALGWGLDARFWQNTAASVRNTFSNASREGAHGTQASVSLSSGLTERLSASVSATMQTSGYRDLLDTTIDTSSGWLDSRYRNQYTASLNWSDPVLGGINLAYTGVRPFNGTNTDRLVASWGKTFKYATVNASFETALGGSGDRDRAGRGAGANNAFYLNVSIPLGQRNVRTYVNRRENRTVMGAALSEKVNDYVNYRVAAERHDGRADLTGNVALTPRYTQLNLGLGRYGNQSTNYSGQIRGGVALHGGGITASPYPIQDTFGVLSVGDISGVKVSTPYGPVWTDMSGQAVIPQLPAYQSSRIELDTKTLPRNVDIRNGFRMVEAGRGSVNNVEFDVVRTRRVLVSATDEQGKALPKGSSVIGADNAFVTTVVDNGQIFLANGQIGEALKVSLPDDRQCELTLELPEKGNDEAFYEQASAVCRA
ncbi:hypothetical protein FAZ95_23845 [Trinickia violacea]|uniref:Outer membrane usher protein n=1 Tax=Trinickia violacea TaxID=2571746 RepID=A0A4P8IUX8_9BURK|nr:fimbrial biogenesis usher protein [Trinickia violacea]QCP52216.1 hypothetical protein FAZ95_23845 [Trinickia violacea]